MARIRANWDKIHRYEKLNKLNPDLSFSSSFDEEAQRQANLSTTLPKGYYANQSYNPNEVLDWRLSQSIKKQRLNRISLTFPVRPIKAPLLQNDAFFYDYNVTLVKKNEYVRN